MVQNLKHFAPVDALDAGFFKAPGTGTLFARCTLDASRCVHPMAVAHILSSECLWGCKNLMMHEQKAYGDDIQGIRRVTIVDGGVALNRSQGE
eukprot:2574252-Pleurochrysis_carterae.AAC.1